MKFFIITIDTEGDNLWGYKDGDHITTQNAKFLSRFQDLCNRFDFIPVWLTNYEMAESDEYVEFVKKYIPRNLCEIGIHVHAWNNPPHHELTRKFGGNPYLIEYPVEIMEKKFLTTLNLIKDRIGVSPKSHRSGRWAMDDRYFKLLEKHGIIADCSITPYISWTKSPGATIPGGSDYSKASPYVHEIGSIVEVPMTIRKMSIFNNLKTAKQFIKRAIWGNKVWLRPATNSLQEMIDLVNIVDKDPNCDYLEFMIHSSELMPGGSPYFKDSKSIEQMYNTIEALFHYIKGLGYSGISLYDYASSKKK